MSTAPQLQTQLSIVAEGSTDGVSGGLTNGRNIRPLSRSSNTSMDSTGSNHIHEQEVVPNGEVSHMTNGVDHVTSGEVTSSTVVEESTKQSDRPNNVNISSETLCKESNTALPIANEGSPKTLTSSSSSETISSRRSSELESLSHDEELSRLKAKMIGRRQTYHTGMLSAVASQHASLTSSLSSATSASRRYTNVAQCRAMSISGGNVMGSLRSIQLRKSTSHSLSVKQRSRKTSTSAVVSPTHNPDLKLIKIVLTGNDILVSHTAKAYAYLQMEEPNLFSGIEMRFYHVPLSRASVLHGIDIGGSSLYSATPQNPDLPEPLLEQVNISGNDVHIGRFMAHMDSWYERNLMIAVHHLLRILPSVS